MKLLMKRSANLPVFWLLLLPVLLSAQQDDSDIYDDEDIYTLSPFEISNENDDTYTATETLGGTRIRTDLRDLATPITAITEKFLEDTASNNNQDLLLLTTNTEVGGLYGNWGGVGNGQGISDRDALLSPNNSTRVRGLDQADNTRNFFLSEIPWDSYNVDRVEIQRGPNSILFGVGSPAGIINTMTIVAQMDGNSGKIKNQYGSFNSNRIEADYNVEVIDDVLAVRVAGLYNDQKFRQKPAFNTDERVFATATYQQQLIPVEWADKTTVKLSVETAQIESNNPRILPPEDAISLWFEDAGGDGVNDLIGLGKGVVDTFLWNQPGGGDPTRGPLSNSGLLTPRYQPGITAIDGGSLNNGGLGFWFVNGQSRPYFVSRQAPRVYPGALAADGSVDNAIDIPFGGALRVGGYNAYTVGIDRIDSTEGRTSRFPLASRGYYKDRSLTDESIFNFYDQLIDGDNKREFKDWDYANFSIAQTFFNSRVGVEFVYDRQDYRQWREGASWNRPYITIDINKNLQHQVSQYDWVDGLLDVDSYRVPGFSPSADQPYANPMAGAAMLSAGGLLNNNKLTVERETMRFTGFGEIRASDFMDEESWLAKLIGRHVITALSTREEKYQTDTSWRPAAVAYDWAYNLSVSGETTKLNEATRGITPIIYLSDPLFNRNTASGLNLGPIRSYYNPSGTYAVDYFKTEWLHPTDSSAAGYVDPGAPWTNLLGDPGGVQADNPFNYAGRTTGPAYVLNAQAGERDQLTTTYGVTEQVVDSVGFVWQGFLMDGLLVPTVGWREDKLETYTATGAVDETGIASTSATPDELTLENTGETLSWGLVAHVPQKWIEEMPVVSGLSAYYNVGENQKVEARYNFDGQPLANPSAESEDYGIVLRMFDDKLAIKFGHYETKVKNGNLPGGASMIGANQDWIFGSEAWGTACAFIYAFGHAGLDPNQAWHWNWADVNEGFSGEFLDPSTDGFKNHPATIAQRETISDWINGMDQAFYDAYAIPVNVSQMQAAWSTWESTGNIQPMVDVAADAGFAVGTYTTGLWSATNGTINGIRPNGTIDSVSKGYEIEVSYQPVPNWNIQINASKTDAYRESLGQPMLDYISQQVDRYAGPAGDMRIWWGGERVLRDLYDDNITSAVEFQEESVGFQAPELRPWKFAAITNYSFSGDKFKGFNIGGAFRYQDEQILGYALKDDLSGLSVEKPIYGETETHLDIWLGYEKSLTDKVDWRVQLNVRNLGEDVGLTPISANPDGTIAAQRITEGMVWTLSNTFSF